MGADSFDAKGAADLAKAVRAEIKAGELPRTAGAALANFPADVAQAAGRRDSALLRCCDAGDGFCVASGGDKTVRVWDGAAGGAPLLVLEGHKTTENAVACHRAGDGWRYVSGGRDAKPTPWNPMGLEPVNIF
mgnify:CR=1 FL=1